MTEDQVDVAPTELVDLMVSNNTNNGFLTFRLSGEEYGIDILKVQEVRGYEAITKIANAPKFI